MSTNDTPDVGKTYTGALELLRAVQPLKHAKEFIDVLHVESHTIVANEEYGFVLAGRAPDFDHGLLAGAGVLDGVGEQVLQNEPQHGRITADLEQLSYLPGDIPSLHLEPHIVQRLLHELVYINDAEAHLGAPHAGEVEKVVDESTGMPGRCQDRL